MEYKKITLRQHSRQFDTLWKAAIDLGTTPSTYSAWLKGGRPKIEAHRILIEKMGIKKWW
jgi:hypothetical protein